MNCQSNRSSLTKTIKPLEKPSCTTKPHLEKLRAEKCQKSNTIFFSKKSCKFFGAPLYLITLSKASVFTVFSKPFTEVVSGEISFSGT